MLAYEQLLNKAQYEVVSADFGPLLVIAGAGTGKTRTIVYRLAWLVEHGVGPHNIVLLTFTRKAAREMLDRATDLLGSSLHGLHGGTFHAFAYRVLRQFKPHWLGSRPFTVLDSADQQDAIRRCREATGIGRNERGFPKVPAIVGIFSKARNKEMSIGDLLAREQPWIHPYAEDLEKLERAYDAYRREMGLLDYDDLLYELEEILLDDTEAREVVRRHCRHILVDEYQDTNLVQARLVKLMAGELDGGRSVMAVGDEAQSIYAFRGATVRNILDFPKLFPGTRVVPLEENYRSIQPVLDVANRVLSYATEGYEKHLVAVRTDMGDRPKIVCCATDGEQARGVAQRIAHCLESVDPGDIAVLFRSGYQSYQLEAELVKLHIPYRKFGGMRFQEAAHVKDLLAYLNCIVNPGDFLSFNRIAVLHDKLGPKTAEKIFRNREDGKFMAAQRKKWPGFFKELDFLEEQRYQKRPTEDIVADVMELYEPHLHEQYPEDYPGRWMGLQELQAMASRAEELDLFIGDVLLDSADKEESEDECVTLSTIHSAKGLEWKHVFVTDLVEGRMPSKFAESRPDVLEEERRLMYVACTRAKDCLELYWYSRSDAARMHGGDFCCDRSSFLEELYEGDADECGMSSTGRLRLRRSRITRPAGLDPSVLVALGEREELPCGVAPGGDRKGVLFEPGSEPGIVGGIVSGPGPEDVPDEVYDEDAGDDVAADAGQGGDAGSGDEGAADGPAGAGYLVPADVAMAHIRSGRASLCQHRIFGEGRILGVDGQDRLTVNFGMHGTKKIMPSYIFVKVKDIEGERGEWDERGKTGELGERP